MILVKFEGEKVGGLLVVLFLNGFIILVYNNINNI